MNYRNSGNGIGAGPAAHTEDWKAAVYSMVWAAMKVVGRVSWTLIYTIGACLLFPFALLFFLIGVMLFDDVSVDALKDWS